MAAKKKKKKAKKVAARKAPARKAKKSRSAASKRPAKKAAKRPAKKAGKKAAKAARKAPARKASAKKPAKKKKQIVGEGDYEASRAFLKDQANFVEKNKANIPAMGREAEDALDGPEGNDLRNAEATAAARSRDTF